MTDITGGLITLEFAAAALNYAGVGSGGNAARDADLATYVQAATPVIEDIAGSCLQVTRTRSYDGGYDYIQLNEIASSVTTVTEAGNTITDWFFDPLSNCIYSGTVTSSRIFYPGRLAMVVTYVTGYATIPMNLQMATRELVRFWVQQGKQGWRPNAQTDSDSVAWTPSGFAVPKRVIELCVNKSRDLLGGFA